MNASYASKLKGNNANKISPLTFFDYPDKNQETLKMTKKLLYSKKRFQ